MTVHRYPAGAINADLARAGAGIAVCAAPLAFAGVGTVGAVGFGLAITLFAGFGVRTLRRRTAEVTVDETGVAVAGHRRTAVRWNALERVKLSYFSTRRDREGGWMQLSLRAPDGRVSLDSSLPGFDAIAARAWVAARERDAEMSATTVRNFIALGIAQVDEDGPSRSALETGWGSPAEWRR